jgi:hypothetical protein
MDFKKTLSARVDRRKLLRNLGVVGAGAVLTACGPRGITPPPDNGNGAANLDAAILNFALNLEYLEAAFYLAVVGRLSELPGGDADIVLPAGYDPSPGSSLYPAVGPIDNPIAEYAQELADDELNHVVFLRNALQGAGAPVAERPVINLADSFEAAASVAFAGVTDPSALGLPADFTPADFNPFANDSFFLHGAFIFEDVGVSAYHGAAEFITDPAFLRAAAGILAVEAYHSGSIRTQLYAADMRRADFFGGLDTWSIVNAISNARDSLNPGVDNDQGVVGNPNFPESLAHEGPDGLGANIVPGDQNSITIPRTPRQVANIVYLGVDTASGGFFPDGISIPAGLEDDFATLLGL